MNRSRITLIASVATLSLACGLLACGPPQKAAQKASGGPDSTTGGPAGNTGDDSITESPTTPTTDGCAREISIRCKSPFVDGCTVAHPNDPSRKLTTDHLCVSAQPSATSCEAEIALECGDGAQDACLMDPPIGDVHFCAAI